MSGGPSPVFIVRARGGSILAVYSNEPAAQSHLRALPTLMRDGSRYERWTVNVDTLPAAQKGGGQ